MTLRYAGAKYNIPRYACQRGSMDNGEPRSIAFGGLRVDDPIEAAVLEVVGPGAVEAAVRAEAEATPRRDEARETLARDLEAARYATDPAILDANNRSRSNGSATCVQLVRRRERSTWRRCRHGNSEIKADVRRLKALGLTQSLE